MVTHNSKSDMPLLHIPMYDVKKKVAIFTSVWLTEAMRTLFTVLCECMSRVTKLANDYGHENLTFVACHSLSQDFSRNGSLFSSFVT